MFSTQFMLSFLVATLAGYTAGMLWFSARLFMNPWLKALGKTKDDLSSNKKEVPRIMAYGFINTAAMAYALGAILWLVPSPTLITYIQVALFLCFSFIITTKFNDLIYASHEPHWSKKPQILFLVNSGYYIFSFSAMALAFWFTKL